MWITSLSKAWFVDKIKSMFGKKSVTYFIIFVVAVSVFAGVVIFVKKGLELPFPVPKTELSEKAKEQEKRDTQISELRALRQQAISQAPELTFREEEGKKEQEMGELKALREEQLSFEPETHISTCRER